MRRLGTYDLVIPNGEVYTIFAHGWPEFLLYPDKYDAGRDDLAGPPPLALDNLGLHEIVFFTRRGVHEEYADPGDIFENKEMSLLEAYTYIDGELFDGKLHLIKRPQGLVTICSSVDDMFNSL